MHKIFNKNSLKSVGTRKILWLAFIFSYAFYYQAVIANDTRNFSIKEVSNGIYVHTGQHVSFEDANHDDIANIGFIIGNNCIAVIDTGGSYRIGNQLKDAIKKTSKLPICYVINTHIHFDHVLGNQVFSAENPEFIGHINLQNEMEQNRGFFLQNFKNDLGPNPSETSIIAPTITVENSMEIDLGARILKLTAYPVAHSHSDLTVLDTKTNTLWLGDLLFTERIPALDGSLKGWLKTIDNLSEISADTVIPGHGEVTTQWPLVINKEKAYLTMLLQETRAAIADGLFLEDALNQIGQQEKEKWLLHEQHHGRNVSKAFTELEWE